MQVLMYAKRALCVFLSAVGAYAQLPDRTLAPNTVAAGISKSYSQEIGAGRGTLTTANSSLFIINRDPFRAVRRGREIFQRKFRRANGQGPAFGDGVGNINTDLAIGAGLADSCASCHGRPKGAAGFGGDVVTRPDSRDAAHLFGLGLKEMLGDEITTELRAIRAQAKASAAASGHPVTRALSSKGISYGQITARSDGSFDTSHVDGVNPDLRVRPFFAHGGTISIREFINGAFKNEMGLESVDPDTYAASHNHAVVVTPGGMVLDGAQDAIEAPITNDPNADPDTDGVINEVPTSIVDYMEFYLLNYFKPATYKQTDQTRDGKRIMDRIGCTGCHKADLQINRDRRVADLDTEYDPQHGVFNGLFATANPLLVAMNDGSGLPTLKKPALKPFLVKNIFTDLKRHDLGPNFYERNYDGTLYTEFMTTPLWGVGSTAPYGHDGRSINLTEVILRHGGEARDERNAFDRLNREDTDAVLAFLQSLVIFPPDDTASTLDPATPGVINFPQAGHGSIKLTVLFNDPTDVE